MSATSPLSDVPVGTFVRIDELLSEPDVSNRLRELGFCENAVIRLTVNAEGNLICEVCNSRIGLNEKIARTIRVSAFA